MIIGKAIRVNGRVQGVGFRWATQMVANDLHVTGFVRNEADGSVYIEVVGTPLNVAQFTAKIKAGPTPYARVATMTTTPLDPPPSFRHFSVRGF